MNKGSHSETVCEEHNWQWENSTTPLLLLRWVAMDWGEITENDLVALMIAPVEHGDSTTGEDDAFELVTTNGAPQWKLRGKKSPVKGGFTHALNVIMALEHLTRLMAKSKGIAFANTLVQPLRDWHKQQNGHIETFCSLVSILPVSVAEQHNCVHEPGATLWLRRKINKLSKWESQSPADRNLSDHAQRLESQANSPGKQSYRERMLNNHGAAIRLDTGFAIRCL
jgi:hypothetical protein